MKRFERAGLMARLKLQVLNAVNGGDAVQDTVVSSRKEFCAQSGNALHGNSDQSHRS